MKKYSFFLIAVLFSLLFYQNTFSQKSNSIWEGDLKSEQLKEFYKGNYTSINGSAFIHGVNEIDLTLLSNLIEVKNDLHIGYSDYNTDFHEGNEKLESLKGLEKLIIVRGKLNITRNRVLADISALSNLKSVNSLNISYNESLASLSGLRQLTSLKGGINIYKNRKLQNLNGLDGLKYVGEYASFNRNLSLISLKGIEKLKIVGGELSVRSNENLINIRSLSNLEKVGGNVFIENNPILKSLEGLEKIDSVQGNLYIEKNHSIKNLQGLNGICYVQKDIEISKNNSLIDLKGLEIKSIQKNIEISKNPSLKNLVGLHNLQEINGTFEVSSNENLESLTGFPGLETIEGRLEIINNNKLTSLDGLRNIKSIHVSLSIYGNGSLKNLKGMGGLKTIGRSLIIHENSSLINLTGLERLNNVGYNIVINGNDSLISLEGLSSLVAIGNEFSIIHNKSLKTLMGPSSLIQVKSNLIIEENPGIIDIIGFKNLTTINGNLSIEDNRHLIHLNGFNSLKLVEKDIRLDENISLTSIEGFNALKNANSISIDFSRSLSELNAFNNLQSCESLTIESTNLPNIKSLINLTKIRGRLYLNDNKELINLKGLDNLNYIEYSFRLAENPNLLSLDGLQNLKSIKSSIYINENKNLGSLKALSKLKEVKKEIEITENERLYDFTGISTGLLSNKDLALSIYRNCYNPTKDQLQAGNYTPSPYPLNAEPFIKEGQIVYEYVYSEFDDYEEYDYEGDDEEVENEAVIENEYWQRGSIFESNIEFEKLYHVKSHIQGDDIRFYFWGVFNKPCMNIEKTFINLYELEPGGEIFIIDSFSYQYNDLYEYSLMQIHFNNLELKNNKLYYHKSSQIEPSYGNERDYYKDLVYYEYIPGSKKKAVVCSTPNNLYDKSRISLSRDVRCILSPDRKKVAWTTNDNGDINIAYIQNWNQKLDELITIGGEKVSLNGSNGDFNVFDHFPHEEDTYALFGGMSWNSDSDELYFDNTGIDLACIWKLSLGTKSIVKIVPEHDAILPHCFKYKGRSMVAYTCGNRLMICEPK